MQDLPKYTYRPKQLSKASYHKYEYLIMIIDKFQQKLKLRPLRVNVLKSNHVNAGVDIHYHLLLVTNGLLKVATKNSLLGMVAHEFGHLISLKDDKAKKYYHLYHIQNGLVQSEYVADKIAVDLVGAKPVLDYLEQSKNILLKQQRAIPFLRYKRTYRYLPKLVCTMLVRLNHPRDWYADDYLAPTLDGRIMKLKQNN